MRAFEPIKLDQTFTPGTKGDCTAWCGREDVFVVGTLASDTLCSFCYEQSKERTFSVWLYGGEDVGCDGLDSLKQATDEIETYLQDPDQWARYAPFVIRADAEDGRSEIIATIDMPAAHKQRSRKQEG